MQQAGWVCVVNLSAKRANLRQSASNHGVGQKPVSFLIERTQAGKEPGW